MINTKGIKITKDGSITDKSSVLIFEDGDGIICEPIICQADIDREVAKSLDKNKVVKEIALSVNQYQKYTSSSCHLGRFLISNLSSTDAIRLLIGWTGVVHPDISEALEAVLLQAVLVANNNISNENKILDQLLKSLFKIINDNIDHSYDE